MCMKLYDYGQYMAYGTAMYAVSIFIWYNVHMFARCMDIVYIIAQ